MSLRTASLTVSLGKEIGADHRLEMEEERREEGGSRCMEPKERLTQGLSWLLSLVRKDTTSCMWGWNRSDWGISTSSRVKLSISFIK